MRLAVLGDIHGAFGPEDVAHLDADGLDAVLVVGDLGGRGHGVGVAERLAALTTPTFVVPGNHDGLPFHHMIVDMQGPRLLADRVTAGLDAGVAAIREALGRHTLGGYSRHDLGDVQLVIGRPHSYGGPHLGFPAYLNRTFGVDDLAASRDRLVALFEACDDRPIVVLAHNGPHGLGDRRDDPFGRDFHRDQGDWGDRDLAAALDVARAMGRRIVAVVAGHMHHRLSGGGARRTEAHRAETLVVNAAQVPRVQRGRRHHVLLTVEDGAARADTVWTAPRT